MLVLGAEGDRICRTDDVVATAHHHGVEAVLVPGLAHMLMLEPEWALVAQALSAWMDAIAVDAGALRR
jgi:hypothetical protein